MNRPIGWYWVKLTLESKWAVAYWDGEIFEKNNWYMYDDDLAMIGERIEDPKNDN